MRRDTAPAARVRRHRRSRPTSRLLAPVRPPLAEVGLQVGDMLYVPQGWWHAVAAAWAGPRGRGRPLRLPGETSASTPHGDPDEGDIRLSVTEIRVLP
ncbi:JmjC domain-containing protein [Streptomyces erythrochromogenes]|uniref:JmjC domain-containing protein n=1 Tax=Streptomyces erythrochromogenes TaxID=285574 RepID=UPI00368FB9C1